MTEKKIELVEISHSPWENRWTELQKYLKEKNVTLNCRTLKIENGNFKELFSPFVKLPNPKMPVNPPIELPDILIIDPNYGVEALEISPLEVAAASQVGAGILFLKSHGKLWPRILLEDSMTRSLTRHFKSIDIFSPALIAGIDAYTNFTVSALCKMGFTKIYVTDSKTEKGKAFTDALTKKYFNIHLEFVPSEKITTLPGIFSFLVCATELSYEDKLLDEIYFFNFLKAGGSVVDWTLVPLETPVLSQAKEWGARCLSGVKIIAEYDTQIINNVLGQISGLVLSADEYTSRLETQISQIPFDPAPFLKRFLDRF